MKARALGIVVAVLVILGGTLGVSGRSEAGDPLIQVMIGGGFSLPMATSGDGQITLRLGVGLPVFMVSDGVVVPGPVGTAAVAQWIDGAHAAGFGELVDLIVFRFGEGAMLVAAGIATAGGPVTTLSATPPFETLSGTWGMNGGVGSDVSGAGAGDLVVTLTPALNPNNTIAGFVRFVAAGFFPSQTTKPIPGLATTQVTRDVPVLAVADDTVGPRVGTLTSYTAFDVVGSSPEFVQLTAIDFAGVLLLYGCAFPTPNTGGIACLAGATGPGANLSGVVSETAGMFLPSIAQPPDLVVSLTGSLP